MTIVYKNRKTVIKQMKAEMLKAEKFPVKTFEKDFTAYFKEIIQPQWKKEYSSK